MATIVTGRTTGYYPSFAVHRGYLYIADGINRTIKVHPNITSASWMGIPEPSTACTGTSSSTGVLTGLYNYVYTHYNKNTDTESDPSPSVDVQVSGKRILLSGIKPDPYISSTGTTHAKIYRTLTSGTIHFYVNSVATGTSTYTDNASDATVKTHARLGHVTTYGGISNELYVNGVCPAFYGIENYKNRLMLFGDMEYTAGHATMASSTKVVFSSTSLTRGMEGKYYRVDGDTRKYFIKSITPPTTAFLTEAYGGATGAGKHYHIFFEPNRVYYTGRNPNAALTTEGSVVEGVNMENDYLDIVTDDNDVIVAGKTIGNDVFGIWKKYSVHAMTEISDRFISHPVTGGIGCISYRSMDLTHEKQAVYLASDDRFIITNMSQFTDVSSNKIRKFLRDYTATAYLSKAHGIVMPDDPDVYMCAIPILGQTEYHTILRAYMPTWDWTILVRPTSCFGKVESSNKKYVYFGDTRGFYYRMNDGTNDGALGTVFSGTATAFTSTSVTCSGATFYTTGSGLTGNYVHITSGPGNGQRRRITSNTATQLNITPNWTRIPTSTSVISVGAVDSSAYTKRFDLDEPNKTKLLNTLELDYELQNTSSSINIESYEGLYESGTISCTNGATAATATGKRFTSADIGKSLIVVGEPVQYRIVKVTTSTSISLENTFVEGGGYLGTTGAGKRFQMSSKTVTLPMNTNNYDDIGIHQSSELHQLSFGSNGTNKPWKINKYVARFAEEE